ncbi:MAG: hypothetical protein ACLU37_06915 [Collinsella sp.]
MATGWRQVGGAWYYFSGSGAMAHDAWVGDYYLQSSGAMATNAWLAPTMSARTASGFRATV